MPDVVMAEPEVAVVMDLNPQIAIAAEGDGIEVDFDDSDLQAPQVDFLQLLSRHHISNDVVALCRRNKWATIEDFNFQNAEAIAAEVQQVHGLGTSRTELQRLEEALAEAKDHRSNRACAGIQYRPVDPPSSSRVTGRSFRSGSL